MNHQPDIIRFDDILYKSIGNYIIFEKPLSKSESNCYAALHIKTDMRYICKIFPKDKYEEYLQAYLIIGPHEHINEICDILIGKTRVYAFFSMHYGKLYDKVRKEKQMLKTICSLAKQIISAVHICHKNGIVLKRLGIDSFVFKDKEQTQIKLLGLEDIQIIKNADSDRVTSLSSSKRFSSPEMLVANNSFSAKSANMFTVGIILNMLLRRKHPHHHRNPDIMASNIARNQFSLTRYPAKAYHLIHNLLQTDPTSRLSANEIMEFPPNFFEWWEVNTSQRNTLDQLVPNDHTSG